MSRFIAFLVGETAAWAFSGNKGFRLDVRYQANFAYAHTNLGDLLIQNGQNGEGVVPLRHAIELNPGDSTAKKLLGQVLAHATVFLVIRHSSN